MTASRTSYLPQQVVSHPATTTRDLSCSSPLLKHPARPERQFTSPRRRNLRQSVDRTACPRSTFIIPYFLISSFPVSRLIPHHSSLISTHLNPCQSTRKDPSRHLPSLTFTCLHLAVTYRHLRCTCAHFAVTYCHLLSLLDTFGHFFCPAKSQQKPLFSSPFIPNAAPKTTLFASHAPNDGSFSWCTRILA